MAATVAACGKPVIKLPSLKQVSTDGLRSEYREYLGIRVCEVEPRSVAEDIRRMNDFWARFLDATSTGKGGSWTDEQLAALETAPKTLKGPLSSHESLVNRAVNCKEFKGTPAQEEAQRGQALVKQTKARLAELPDLLAYQKALQEVNSWKEKQATEQESERANWCPPKPSRTPEIYYAWEDEHGQTEWLFCDGSKVVSPPGGTPGWIPPAEKKPGKAPPPQVYLGSAARFPAKEIHRAPKLPGDVAAPPPESGPKGTGASQP